MTVEFVPANGAFDREAPWRTLTLHALPGVDRDVSTTHERIHERVAWIDNAPVIVHVTLTAAGVRIAARSDQHAVAPDVLRTHARRWFDLDTDIDAVDAALAESDLLRDHVRTRPGMRITRTVDPFEATTMAVIGQQISLAAARVMGGRLVAAFGEAVGDDLAAFPRPGAIRAATVDEVRSVLRVPRARAQTVHDVAALFDGGYALDRDPMLAQLGALRGIGPWTLGYLRIRCLTDPDAFPASDIVLRRAVDREDVSALAQRAEAWAPWRSYAATRLWDIASPSVLAT